MEEITNIDYIIADIKSQILSGKYMSDARLSERMLCEQFGVSRAVIRQAFLMLKESGWLYTIKNSGTYVAPVDHEEIEENYRARLSLEPIVLEMAYPNLTAEDLRSMRQILEDIRANPNKEQYLKEADLHMVFVRRTNNRYVISLFENMLDTMKRLTVLSASEPTRMPKSIAEWSHVVGALENRDPHGASSWLSLHLHNSYKNFLFNNRKE